MLPVLLEYLRVARHGPGRPRTRPDALLADKAYSSRGHRALLRERGIKAVIPERADQQQHRLRRGAAGGRPVSYDTEQYKDRNVIVRSYEKVKQWRGLATRYDKLAVIFRGGAIDCGFALRTCLHASPTTPTPVGHPTLNPRVRGSSPWRRTPSDLGSLPCWRESRVVSGARWVRDGCGADVVGARSARHEGDCGFRGGACDLRQDTRVGVGRDRDARVAEHLRDDLEVGPSGERDVAAPCRRS